MKKALIIYNPASGDEFAADFAYQLGQNVSFRHESVEVISTEEDDSARAITERRSEEAIEAIYVMGGDGTVNEVVNGIKKIKDKPIIGVVPFGTVNNFADMLGFSQDHEEVIEEYKNVEIKQIDLGQAEDTLFISSVTIGLLPKFVEDVSEEEKRQQGAFAFLSGAVEAIGEDKTNTYEITINDESKKIEASLILIANGNSLGRIATVFPNASLDDGKLTFFALKESTSFEKLAAAKDAILDKEIEGSYTQLESVQEVKVDLIDKNLSEEDQLIIMLDGDSNLHFPLEIKILPKALSIYVPKKAL